MTFAVCSWSLSDSRVLATQANLGHYPFCEPSAAVNIPCPGSEGRCLLVGDNESDKALLLYAVNAKQLKADRPKELSLGAFEIDDIEAIATLHEGSVLIMGSHSRNKKCEVKKTRQRFVQAKILPDKLAIIGSIVESPAIKAADLFKGIDLHLPSNHKLAAISRAIDDAEAAAQEVQGHEHACQKVNAFNIEGALALLDHPTSPEVWVGLRSPLVKAAAGPDEAVLLQMVSLDTLRFGAVAFVRLEGRGIRELTLDKIWIWGIAGGPEDDKDNFVLWRIRRDELKPNVTLTPEIVRPLPASSEGLAIVEQTAYVLIDGDKDKDTQSCKHPGSYFQLDLQ